jgi:hypothetical protein
MDVETSAGGSTEQLLVCEVPHFFALFAHIQTESSSMTSSVKKVRKFRSLLLPVYVERVREAKDNSPGCRASKLLQFDSTTEYFSCPACEARFGSFGMIPAHYKSEHPTEDVPRFYECVELSDSTVYV